MKKIISGLLLHTILLLADQNNTNHLEDNLSTKIELIENEYSLLQTANIELQNNLEKFKLENKKLKEKSDSEILKIESIPEVKLAIDQPMNWTLFILPIISMLITMLIIYLSYRSTRKQLELNYKQSNEILHETLKHEKELKQKEIMAANRQKWINELRSEISKFISEIITIRNIWRSSEKKEQEVIIDTTKQHLSKVIESKVKINLLLNIKEEMTQKTINLIDEIIKSGKPKKGDNDHVMSMLDELMGITQIIIKEEWKKIKE